MAVPKRKTSKHRKRIRRSHHHLTLPPMARCSRCGGPTRPHTVCPSCGYYRGLSVLPNPSEASASA